MIRIWEASVCPLDYPSFVQFGGNHCVVFSLLVPRMEITEVQ